MLLGSIRARLMALLALAAVPVIALAALVAWQSYTAAGDQARQIVLVAREAASARHEAVLMSARRMVAALSSRRAWSDPPDACAAFLSRIAALEGDGYGPILAVRADGSARCSSDGQTGVQAGADLSAAPWFMRMKTDMKPVDGLLASDPTGDAVVIARPVLDGGAPEPFAGALVLFLRPDWFARPAERLPGASRQPGESWLGKPDGALVPIGDARAGDLPSPRAMARLGSAGAGVRLALSADGELFAYAVAPLSDSLHLLTGFPAQSLIGPARRVLIVRFAVLGLLMLAGMAVVALGADRAVAQPVKTLTRSVRRWRTEAPRGVPFDPGPSRRMPAEIVELSQAFAETTGTLAEREAQLGAAVVRQDLLMKEIHHRVKNNLQIVASLLNLQANRIMLPAARAEFQSARDRVRALATLHRHLYSEGELHTINMRGFLTELCGQLFQAMGESEGDRIHLDIEAPELAMSSDQATPLSLIVTEAVSNSLKYAFPGARRGTISVRLTAQGRTATLVIQDDGVGIPLGKAETESGPRDGLGLQLMTGFARQLGSELRVEEAPDGRPGTRYTVAMALQPEPAAA